MVFTLLCDALSVIVGQQFIDQYDAKSSEWPQCWTTLVFNTSNLLILCVVSVTVN